MMVDIAPGPQRLLIFSEFFLFLSLKMEMGFNPRHRAGKQESTAMFFSFLHF